MNNEITSMLASLDERQLLEARDLIDDMLDGLAKAQEEKGAPMYLAQPYKDYQEEHVDGDAPLLTKTNITQSRVYNVTTRQRALIEAMFGGKICGEITIISLSRLSDGTPLAATCKNNIPREWMRTGSQLTQFMLSDLDQFFSLSQELEETGKCTTPKGKKVRVAKDKDNDQKKKKPRKARKPKVDVDALADSYMKGLI